MLEKLKEDIKQYEEVIDIYSNLNTTDIELAYDLAIKSLLLADTWNEIMLNCTDLKTELSMSKTSLEKWSYHKYRILMTIHEFCRVVWRQGKEESRNSFIGGEY